VPDATAALTVNEHETKPVDDLLSGIESIFRHQRYDTNAIGDNPNAHLGHNASDG
jgi:thiamine phosphate synthase YjbQ (UPF0047 family)